MQMYRAQRDEANRMLRQLRTEGTVVFGKARIARKQPTVYKQEEEFMLSYNVRMTGYSGAGRGTHYVTLFAGTRQECVDMIPLIIMDLQGLYDAAKGVDQ